MVLYRDDGLSIFKNMSGPEAERKKKELVKTFKDNELSITEKTSLKTADFLDIHYCSNFQNQSQKEFQEFHEMKIFLTSQFLITKMP